MGTYNGYYFDDSHILGPQFDNFYCDNCGCYIPPGHRYTTGGNRHFCGIRCFREWADMNPRSDGCFITTATCKSRNLPDDCHELTTLRAFRDNFMKKDNEMKSEVMEYYEIAPSICSKIDRLENSSEIYDSIWKDYLCGAVDAVDAGDNLKAHEIYKSMVLDLKSRFLNEEGE